MITFYAPNVAKSVLSDLERLVPESLKQENYRSCCDKIAKIDVELNATTLVTYTAGTAIDDCLVGAFFFQDPIKGESFGEDREDFKLQEITDHDGETYIRLFRTAGQHGDPRNCNIKGILGIMLEFGDSRRFAWFLEGK
jgi:hypothetical protein